MSNCGPGLRRCGPEPDDWGPGVRRSCKQQDSFVPFPKQYFGRVDGALSRVEAQ